MSNLLLLSGVHVGIIILITLKDYAIKFLHFYQLTSNILWTSDTINVVFGHDKLTNLHVIVLII